VTGISRTKGGVQEGPSPISVREQEGGDKKKRYCRAWGTAQPKENPGVVFELEKSKKFLKENTIQYHELVRL